MNRLLTATLTLLALASPAAANPFTLPFRMASAGARAMKQVATSTTRSMLKGDLFAAAGHMNPINATLLGYQHLTAPNAHPSDPASWAPAWSSGKVSQRGMVDDSGRLSMRTQVQVKTPGPGVGKRAEQAFRGSWTEFGYGGSYTPLSHQEYTRRTGRTPSPEAVTYELLPPAGFNKAPGGLIRVHEQLRTQVQGERMTGKLRLDGHVVGNAHVGVTPNGKDAILEGGFDQVEVGGLAKLLGPATMGFLHGAVEMQGFGNLGKKLELR